MAKKSVFSLSRSRLMSLIAKPWLLPDKALAYFLAAFTRHIRFRVDSFGWLHAILYSCRMDQQQRYAFVAQHIKALDQKPISILDVGGGSGVIGEFLSPKEYRLCILDVNDKALRWVGDSRLRGIAGDGCCLPFKDNSFDVVTSLDSLEHIPEYKKAAYCCEMKRVATGYVIIQCPADSTDGMFLSTVYDTKFLEWHRWHFGKDEMNTAEHLNSGLPKVEELMKLFPGAQISGKQNCELWLRYMKGAFMPYVRIIVGLFYKAFVLKRDNQPPYKSCLLIWRKE